MEDVMAGTELKRYFIKPDGWDEFLQILRRIAVVRERHGFQVLFTFADRELNLFTWAIMAATSTKQPKLITRIPRGSSWRSSATISPITKYAGSRNSRFPDSARSGFGAGQRPPLFRPMRWSSTGVE